MKIKGQKTGPPSSPLRLLSRSRTQARALLFCLSAVLAAALLYEPALNGPFLFDDLGLPFQFTTGAESLRAWLGGSRPALMLTYWINHQFSGRDTFSYHCVNLLIHIINTGLVFYVLSCLLGLAGWTAKRARSFAFAGAAIFLVHPLATESVSYIAGRSESLAALFVLAAYAIFLKRRERGIEWRDAVIILILLAFGVATKENAVALAGVILLTEWVFPRASTRRLYLLAIPAGLLAAVLIAPVILHGGNAGFSIKEFTWYQYAFTQARAILTYARLAFLPIGQSIDHDFPISHTLFEHGAWLCVIVLAALVSLAIWERRRSPLLCFGFLMFLILLAPTSSVIPIADPLVERRMYLPLMGLIIVACGAASRLRLSRQTASIAAAAAVVIFSVLTWQRNQLWGHGEQLLIAAARQSVNNPRPVANLTEMLIANGRCEEALPWLERAGRLSPRSYVVEASWGRALECVGRREEALEHLNRAVKIHPAWKLYELIGLLNGELNRLEAAGAALRTAVELEPRAASTHRSLALWHEAVQEPAAAAAEYRAALLLDPEDAVAKTGLARVQDLTGPSP